MMISTGTGSVIVLPVEGHNILKMVWSKQVSSVEVSAAFHEITSILDNSAQPMDIIVDIRQNPNFPLQTTISEALRGPYNHPMMGTWLVLGSSRMGKIIEGVVTKVGRRNDIKWFKDEKTLSAYLAE